MDEENIVHKVAQYKDFDRTRQADLEAFAQEYEKLHAEVADLHADLDEERSSRRKWRQKAEDAEALVTKNQFALCLIDGDGYIFSSSFLKTATASGGAQAADALFTEIKQYVKSNFEQTTTDLEIITMVFLHKHFIASTLTDAGLISKPGDLDAFFWSFTSSHTLFQVVDCGPGKERADSKIRDTYKFYAYNAQCKHIFLACCHDSGYIAELDKYRHNQTAAPKTILIRHEDMARQFLNLDFPVARFEDVFETKPLRATGRVQVVLGSGGPPPVITRAVNPVSEDTQTTTSPNPWSAVTAGASYAPVSTKSRTSLSGVNELKLTSSGTKNTEDSKGIPVNQNFQRVDRRMQVPSKIDLDAFEARIEKRKLCNKHHLTKKCFAYRCQFDHSPIDATMQNTLRFKARTIPCPTGSSCRDADCFYGHHCPWEDKCTNNRCAFHKSGLHDIKDLEVARLVKAVV